MGGLLTVAGEWFMLPLAHTVLGRSDPTGVFAMSTEIQM